eukprot:13537080-Alexandrium_andersonii.AAC.1
MHSVSGAMYAETAGKRQSLSELSWTLRSSPGFSGALWGSLGLSEAFRGFPGLSTVLKFSTELPGVVRSIP